MNALNPRAVLDRCGSAGVSVRLEGGNLKLRGRQLPPDLLADLRAAKPALVALLTDEAEAAEEQAARQAEKPLPPPGTVERDKADRDHATYLNGMLAAALKRPPSWWEAEPHRPPPGATCSCCRWERWWSRDGRGWCCWTCHSPAPGAAVMEAGA